MTKNLTFVFTVLVCTFMLKRSQVSCDPIALPTDPSQQNPKLDNELEETPQMVNKDDKEKLLLEKYSNDTKPAGEVGLFDEKEYDTSLQDENPEDEGNTTTRERRQTHYINGRAVVWPDGSYALPSSTAGCPCGWSEGWRYHDTEDYANGNHWSTYLPNRVRGEYSSNIKQYYCVKSNSRLNYGFAWPRGRYCIARRGGTCPPNFRTGSIYWDDEDNINTNSYSGSLPDGQYDRNTRIHYCCRSDGSSYTSITLPTHQPFVLYRYGGRCQAVAGMVVTNEYLRFDNEDNANVDSCSGYHPDNDSCGNNHYIHYCYYYC